MSSTPWRDTLASRTKAKSSGLENKATLLSTLSQWVRLASYVPASFRVAPAPTFLVARHGAAPNLVLQLHASVGK